MTDQEVITETGIIEVAYKPDLQPIFITHPVLSIKVLDTDEETQKFILYTQENDFLHSTENGEVHFLEGLEENSDLTNAYISTFSDFGNYMTKHIKRLGVLPGLEMGAIPEVYINFSEIQEEQPRKIRLEVNTQNVARAGQTLYL